MYNLSSLRKTMISSYLLCCLLLKTLSCALCPLISLVSAKSRTYILFLPSQVVGKHEDKYNQLPSHATPGVKEHRFVKKLLAGVKVTSYS